MISEIMQMNALPGAYSREEEGSDVSPVSQAVFAGGCFWCIEAAFKGVDGVLRADSGYTGGRTADPTYEEVSSGLTGHYEAVRVTFDPEKISYEALLDIFWRQINPEDDGGQFSDRGSQYRSAVFYADEQQKAAAEASRQKLSSAGIFRGPVVTEILSAGQFYPAEIYHQNYCRLYPDAYARYKRGSGREGFLQELWGPESESAKSHRWKKPERSAMLRSLSPLQRFVTQENGTEPPFANEYWNEKRDGIYVDVVSGEPLFLSSDKFDSGTGWPSFTRPIEPSAVTTADDDTLPVRRVEVRSAFADSHLGHVFGDGPEPTGLRYCMNSAALKFVPLEKMEGEGYGEFVPRLK